MKKIYSFGAIAASVLSLFVVSCNIDSSYDLGEAADNTQFGIGTDESTFDFPLADINISLSQITSGSSIYSSAEQMRVNSVSSTSSYDVLEIVQDLVAILPSDLSGTAYDGGIDLSRLGETDYVEGLITLLFDELAISADKRESFVLLILDKLGMDEDDMSSGGTVTDPDYVDMVDALESVLGAEISSFNSVSSCADAIEVALNSQDTIVQGYVTDLIDEITDLIVLKSGDIETEFSISETIEDAIDVSDDVLDMLKKNLDGEKNTLTLLFKLDTNLPLNVTLTVVIYLPNGDPITISEFVDALDEVEIGDSLTEEQLDELLQGLCFTASIEMNYYDPALGDLDLSDTYVKLSLIARKRGWIIF